MAPDAVLELGIAELEVAGPFGAVAGVSPLALSGPARLIRVADRRLMRSREIAWHEGDGLELREWRAGVARLRAALERAYRDIARDLVGWLGATPPRPVAARPTGEY